MTEFAQAAPGKARSPSKLAPWLHRIGREKLAVAGAVLVLAHAILAIVAPWVTPYDPYASVWMPLEMPSFDYWMGTDLLGRDLLSRVMVGGRVAMLACFAGVVLATVVGTIIGLLAALIGGIVDEVVMRIIDALMALPEFLLLSVLILAFGSGPGTLIVILAVAYMPGIARTVRAQSKALVALDFIRAAELRGESMIAIATRELLPNVSPLICVEFAIRFSSALLRLSALSFLGVGVRQPIPDWGTMVQEAVGLLASHPFLLLAPAMCLMTLVVGLNFAVDGLARILGVSRS